MYSFDTVIPHGSNFTPSSLIYRFAKKNGFRDFYTRHFVHLISIFGITYEYAHYYVQDNGNGTDTVTIYLKQYGKKFFCV